MFKINRFNNEISFTFPDHCYIDFSEDKYAFFIVTQAPFDFWIEMEPAKKEDLYSSMLRQITDDDFVLDTKPYEIHRSTLKGIATFYSTHDKKYEYYSEKYRLFLCGQLMDFTIFVETSEVIANEHNIVKPPLKKILQYPLMKTFFKRFQSNVFLKKK